MNKEPLHICPRPDITIGQLRAETRRFVSKRDVKLVIADYMQLEGAVARRGASRIDEVGGISCRLKKMALELDLPVIALAQFNSRLKTTTIQVRGWSDLRESGSIEADGDAVIFIRSERKGVIIDSRMLCQFVLAKTEMNHRSCLTSASTGMSAGLRICANTRIWLRRLKSHAAS